MTSIVDPRFPEYPGKVRATLKIAAWLMTPKASGCHVTYVAGRCRGSRDQCVQSPRWRDRRR